MLAGTQALEFRATADDAGRYAWIDSVLGRFEYRRLPCADRAPVLGYLQRLSGYSRATSLPAGACGAAGRGGPHHGHAAGPGHGLRAATPARWFSLTSDSSVWARSGSGICTTCATTRATGTSACCRPRRQPTKNTKIGARRAPRLHPHRQHATQGDLDGIKGLSPARPLVGSSQHDANPSVDLRADHLER